MRFVYLLPIFSTTIWGISIVGAKILIDGPFTGLEIVFGRFLMASLIFAPLLYFLHSRSEDKTKYLPSKKSWMHIIGISITGVSLNNMIFYYGLARTDAGVASLLVSVNPLATMLIAVFLLGEKMNWKKYVSVGLGMVGVSLIVGFADTSGKLLGNMMIVLAVSIWGASFSFSKMASNDGMSPIAITGWSEILGTLTLLPFMTRASWQKYELIFTDLEFTLWFLFLGVIAAFLAYILHYRAVEELGAGKVAPTTNIIPFSGVIAAWILLGERLSGSPIIGLILILAGVLLVQWEDIFNHHSTETSLPNPAS